MVEKDLGHLPCESYEVQQNVYHPHNESENNMCISRLMHTFSPIILFVLLMVLTSKWGIAYCAVAQQMFLSPNPDGRFRFPNHFEVVKISHEKWE